MPGRNHGRNARRPITDLAQEIIGLNDIPFQLLNEIGHGGYGTVWRARNLYASREHGIYAVKVLRKARAGSSHHSFHVREISNHKEVSSHPNIVTMWGVIQDKENLYLVMDYLPGGTLLDLIVKERAFSRNDAFVKGIFLQLIDAVHYSHERGIFHRDLKPENILLNRERSKVFIADFGLSTRTRDSKCFGTGSKNYMSPECLGRRTSSYNCARGDIWALGVILTNMITGRSPWALASLEDPGFMHHLSSGDLLHKRFPISRPAAKILHKIFTPNPAHCISLVELRALVQEIDTFFISEAEIARSSDIVRSVADYLRPREEGLPFREVSENNPPSEDPPIFVVLSTTSDDHPDTDNSASGAESGSASQVDDTSPRALHVPNVVPLVENESDGDEDVAWRRDEKTPAAQVAALGSTDTSSQPDSLSTTSNSSGGLRSFFRLSRQRKSGADPAPPPELSSRQPLLRLAGHFRRILGAA